MSSSSSSGSDRRDSGRRALRTTAQVVLGPAQSFGVRTLDVSPGGMSILCAASPQVGATFRVRFNLPKKPSGSSAVDVAARVVHAVLDGREDGFKVGLQFVDPDETTQAALQNFLK